MRILRNMYITAERGKGMLSNALKFTTKSPQQQSAGGF
jgi:hypothetical protein